jgi:hypothetical protein
MCGAFKLITNKTATRESNLGVATPIVKRSDCAISKAAQHDTA